MTREEFYKKYGAVQVVFSHYYKFTFSYKATLVNGDVLTCDVGGNADEIYKHDVSVDAVETVDGLEPYAGGVYTKDRKEVCSFYDY